MYNLLMSSNPAAFDGMKWQIERDRFGEHSNKEVYSSFETFDQRSIDALQSLPTLFCHEDFNKKGARIGWLEEIRPTGKYLEVRFSFDPFIQEIPYELVCELAGPLDIRTRDWEQNRTHWALKNVDLIHVLDQHKIIKKSHISPYAPYGKPEKKAQLEGIVVRPQFFDIPNDPIDRRLVAVMMPFTSQFGGVYEAISQAAQSVGLRAQKADDIWNHSVLIQDIFGLIYRSHIVVCDFSTKNPNVFYEAGIAHMLGRHVIPITQSADDVPFDLRHHRYIRYLNNGEGLASLSSELRPRLQTLSNT
ncbi:UNVERIFIED_ORG: hypothetical protein GGD59_005708 [Rhizobium esperanzae]